MISPQDRPYWYFVWAITLLTFALRLIHLDYLTLWVDEHVHANIVKYLADGSLITGDNNGILYTISILPFAKLFGVSEFWVRFPSVIYGTLLIPLAFSFCKKYFNPRVGVIVALLLAVSLYVTFWSRICRMYAIFMFFYFLLIYVTAKLCDLDDSYQKRGRAFFDYLKVSPQTLGVFILCLLLATLSHLSAILVFFSISFYHLTIFVLGFFKGGTHRNPSYTNHHALLAYLLILFSLIAFVPALQEELKPFLLLIMPPNVIGFLLPDFNYLQTIPTFATFDMYSKVLSTDMPHLYLLGWAGFVVAILRYKKVGLYLFSVFIVLFMMLSFIFRNITVPRYILFLYPFFLIAMAVSIDEIIRWTSKIFQKKQSVHPHPKFFVGGLILLFFLLPFKAPYQLVTTKAHGDVVPKELSVWHFVDWQEPLKKLEKELLPDDVCMTTMSTYMKFYTGRTSILFRQSFYNTEKKMYEHFNDDSSTENASSLAAIQRLYHAHTRGWLCADYYFDNVMTLPEAKEFIVKHTRFMYEMSNGDVKIFHWDKTKPPTEQNVIVELLTNQSPFTPPYTLGGRTSQGATFVLGVEAEGVQYDGELAVVVNGNAYGIAKAHGEIFKKTNDSKARQWFFLSIDARMLRAQNQIQLYLPNVRENAETADEDGAVSTIKSKIAVYNLGLF